MDIPGYTTAALVSEDAELSLYQATRALDSLPVLLKIPATHRPTPALLRRLTHEEEVARDLDPDRIARPLALERHPGAVALVLEHGPTQTLTHLLGSPMDIPSFLRIAIGISAALAEIHRHGLVHKDVKPGNVLLDESGHVWLTGLGIASRLPRERQAPEPPEIIAGTLAYMAPEQTGRMNRSIDCRSDLYALGITFYQMLTGVLPFYADDPMEWLHCHIARQPVPPIQKEPSLPEPLSGIVMKLLAKNGEDRYQSTVGLDADLHRCSAEWESKGHIDPFPLGAHDLSGRLLIPEELYGRKPELDTLLAAFDRVVASGMPEILLVSGYSGIGKSSVVHELHKALVPPRALFAAGKFDQYRRDIPYSTLVQALETLIRQILGKGEAEVATWRHAMQTAVDPNGQLIVNLIADVELIIGKQPPVSDLPPQEAQNRFQMVLRRFLGCFARPEHPLVLFLDDLQWLDTATLELIEDLGTGQDLRHLLLIGAYRDNEVGPTHPLVRVLETIRKAGTRLREILLAPLAVDDVCSLIADSLHCERERALPLARLVHEKTGGNPFFAIQFLAEMAEEKLLALDPSTAAWTWDLLRINAKGFSDSVVDLMVGKLGRLPHTAREALKQFACLGIVAEVATLSTVCGQSEETVHATLWDAVRSGLVFRQNRTYTFLHDRVHEAAYALVSEASRKALHLKIGRLLLSQYPREVPAERVFDVVEQFNRSIDMVTDADERETLRRLNAAAGRKARAAVAYVSSRFYYEQAIALLPADSWNEVYEESLALFTALAECEYLLGNFRRSDELLTLVLEKARSLLDRVFVYRLRQQLYQHSGRWPDAVSTALEGLELLGVSFPEDDGEILAAIQAETEQIQVNLRGRRIADLADEPFTDDLEVRALLGLLAETMPQFYIVRYKLWPLIVTKTVNLCLERGHVEESPYIYSTYAMMLVGLYDDVSTSFQFSQMSLEFNERLHRGSALRGRPPFFHASVVSIWRQHFRTCLPLLDQAFQACLDSGDLIWASYLTYHAIWLRLENGDPLEEVGELAQRYANFNEQNHHEVISIVNRVEKQFTSSLQGKTRSQTDFSDGTFDESGGVAAIEQAGFGVGVAYHHIMKQIASFIAGDFNEALQWADRVAPVLSTVASMAIWGTHYFYHALTLTALHGQTLAEPEGQFAQKIGEILEKLKYWSDTCPENFANRYFLVSAEIARIEGRDMEAMRFYDQAIRSARDNHFVHQEALAAELAFRFFRARGLETIANAHFHHARDCYARWGARAKVWQLERLHPELTPTQQLHDPILGEHLDAVSLAKAQRAISSEISLDNLVITLLRIVMESAGAEVGFLSVEGAGQLRAEMRPRNGEEDTGHIVFDVSPRAANVPQGIINYVRRSRKTVVLDDAPSGTGEFSADDYLRRVGPKSALCMAIQRSEKLLAVLYLENNLVGGAFTPKRRMVLEVLAAQAAISLESASIYEKLQEGVERLRLTLEATQIGTFDWDVEHDRIDFSPTYYSMLGYEPKEGPGDREEWLERIHPDDRAHVIANTQEVLARDSSSNPSQEYAHEARLRHADGTYRWQLLKGFIVQRDREGRVTRTLGIRMDINERRRAEEERHNAERNLRAIFDCFPDFITRFDKQGRFLYINPALERGMGVKLNDYVGETFNASNIPGPPGQTDMLLALIRRAFEEGSPNLAEAVWPTPEGERTYEIRHIPETNDQGTVASVIGVARDITDRRQLEEQLLQAQKMEAVGQLAGGVAHDFNNMLGVILGHAELLKSNLPKGHPLLSGILEIEKAGIHSRDVTRQLLAFSRKQIITPETTDLNLLIQASTHTLAKLIEETIDLRFLPGEGLWKVRIDPSQINQILINLAVNARDAMLDGGSLTIETANVYLDETYADRHLDWTPGDHVLLTVSDTGVGMDKETAARIFEPFFTTKERGRGTGLGLATVYGIVKQSGGFINVYSEPAIGTTFKIYFPGLVDADDVMEEAEEVKEQTSRSATVLLVEDDDMVRRMAAALLEQIGYSVVTADSPLKALAYFENEQAYVDLLMTDVVMPGMSGTQLADRLKEIRPGLRVLYMSGYTESVVGPHGVLKEGTHFVQKPFRLKDLAREVRRALDDT